MKYRSTFFFFFFFDSFYTAWACRSGHLNIVEALLAAGASIHGGADVDEDAVSPLLAASAAGHVDIVRLLLERGADVVRACFMIFCLLFFVLF